MKKNNEKGNPADIINKMDSKLLFLRMACFNVNCDMKLNYDDIGNGLSALMEDLGSDLSDLRALGCPNG